MSAITDIIEFNEPEEAAYRLGRWTILRDMERVQKEIANTFSTAVAWGRVLTPEQMQEYQRIWNDFDHLLGQIKEG